jgi:hypothetical protein
VEQHLYKHSWVPQRWQGMVSKNARGKKGVARYFTILGMLHACVGIFALEDGKHVHKEIIRNVATLALGSRPRQGVARLRAKCETREHSTCFRECKECEGMNLHTPKWTPMLGVGVPKGLSNF